MRISIALFIPLFLFTALCLADEPNPCTPIGPEYQKPVTLKYDNAKFSEVIADLKKQTGFNIYVDWQTLEAAGLERSNPITLDISEAPFDKAIQLILDQLGRDLVPLKFEIESKIVVLSTTENLNRNVYTQTYAVADICLSPPPLNSPELPTINAQYLTSDPESSEKELERIINLIQETVDPDGWKRNGGVVSSLTAVKHNLVIRTTRANHCKIRAALDSIRAVASLQLNVTARIALVPTTAIDRFIRESANHSMIFKPQAADDFEKLLQDPATKSVALYSIRTVMPNQKHVLISTHIQSELFGTPQNKVVPSAITPQPSSEKPAVNPTRAVSTPVIVEATPPLRSSITAAANILDIEAAASEDQQKITMTIRATFARPPFDPPVTAKPAANNSTLLGPTPDVSYTHFLTTATIPNSGAVILSSSLDDADKKRLPEGYELVLFLRASVLAPDPAAKKP